MATTLPIFNFEFSIHQPFFPFNNLHSYTTLTKIFILLTFHTMQQHTFNTWTSYTQHIRSQPSSSAHALLSSLYSTHLPITLLPIPHMHNFHLGFCSSTTQGMMLATLSITLPKCTLIMALHLDATTKHLVTATHIKLWEWETKCSSIMRINSK